MTRLIDADAFEAYVQNEWEQNEISNSDWITFREWLNDQEPVLEYEGDLTEVIVKGEKYQKKDVPERNVGDLISRQAAIDAVEKESQVDGAYGYMDTKSIIDLLCDLPSAQPEIIRCKDCKHRPVETGPNHDLEFPCPDNECPCQCDDYYYSWMPNDDWFCANGKRKEE